MKRISVLALALVSIGLSAQEAPQAAAPPQRSGQGQRGPGGGGMFMRGGSVGTITEIKDGVIKVKTDAGKTVTVKTTADTRFIGKDRTPAAIKDLKVGDAVMAGGPAAGEDAIDARMVALLDEDAVKRMKEAQANLGKANITGEVK